MKKSLILFVTLLLVHMFMGSTKTIDMTDRENEQNVKELIIREYQTEEYDLYSLYDSNDSIVGYLAEFEDTYAYVLVNNNSSATCNGKNSQFYLYKGELWKRGHYENVEPNKVPQLVYESEIFNCSHFKAANVIDEKMYLLDLCIGQNYGHYIPAIKKNDRYINLVSMQEFELRAVYGIFDEMVDSKIYFGKDSKSSWPF